jgi:rSAM/selenodomain-associated transferase 1
MAKPAVAGKVKTRLIGALAAEQAAAVHRAMWRTVIDRVTHAFSAENDVQLTLALAGGVIPVGESVERYMIALPSRWRTIDQGNGDLGERLDHVWRSLGSGRIMFLGVDSPDIPLDALRQAWEATATHDVAVGPVADGGYWTLSCRQYEPTLLQGIDWGGANVYDQTLQKARARALRVAPLRRWHDVDDPADLLALRNRLAASDDRTLHPLRRALDELCS